jgi:hypothetical protein
LLFDFDDLRGLGDHDIRDGLALGGGFVGLYAVFVRKRIRQFKICIKESLARRTSETESDFRIE